MGKVFCNQQRLQAIVEEVHVADSQCSLQCNCEWTAICVKTPLFYTLCLLLLFARSLTTIVFNNCKIHKTLVNGWRQPLLSNNKNMMLFLLYLQMFDTATVFSPNGNEDAMIFFAYNVLYDALVPILSCLYFYLPNILLYVWVKNIFLGVMLFNLWSKFLF